MTVLVSAAELLATLEDAGVTVTFDRPTGQLHVRPRPVPASAAELIRPNREILADFLAASLGSCSRCGTTDAAYLVPTHWNEELELCSTCCQNLDAGGAIPDADLDPQPASGNAEAVDTLLATGIAQHEYLPDQVLMAKHGGPNIRLTRLSLAERDGDTGVGPVRAETDEEREFCRRPGKLVPPADWVRLGAEARERYRAKNGKVKDRKLTHVWAACDVCGEGIMRAKGAGPKKCVITPGCEGRHVAEKKSDDR
jgi:hypothetical protein